MRIVFMGTPRFALAPLERLIESRHDVLAVVTQPDKAAGRGRQVRPSLAKQLAIEHGLELLQPDRIRDQEFLDRLGSLAPDLIVVVAYGKKLPAEVLDLPRLGCINLHASLLPAYRGAAPINWAIINGDTETGLTIMKIDEGMDTGEIVSQEAVEILGDDDAESLGDMLSVLGSVHLVRIIDQAESDGCVTGTPQDDSLATRAPILNKSHGLIDWSRSAEQLACLVRGTKPWPGAHTPTAKGTLKILRAEPLWPEAVEQIGDPDRFEPGTVALLMRSHGFAVRTLDGYLLVTQAQLPGKRAMSGVDMMNGKHVERGDRLVAP